MGLSSIRRKVKEDREEFWKYCRGGKGRVGSEGVDKGVRNIQWGKLSVIITTKASKQVWRKQENNGTRHYRKHQAEKNWTKNYWIRDQGVTSECQEHLFREMGTTAKLQESSEWWWENGNTENRLFSLKCLIMKRRRKTEGCWSIILPCTENIFPTAKFRFSTQVRPTRKPPDSLGFCIFILERAQQSPYNNLQHVHFCLKSLSDCKFWINCFGWIQVKWFFVLLEFCQKSYISFKFPCYCYLEDCQFRNIPSSKYNFNFQVTKVKVYFHLKKVERGDRERKVGRK